ncbi:MAG: VOC family protein, partial [Aeromonas sobria]
MINIGMHFEIPVTDMQRAIAFYSAVFDIEFERAQID